MCWSAGASIAMTAAGGAAMVVSAARGDPKAIWLTLGYFTVMEALQAAGYAVVDQCGSNANQGITLLSYLHIAGQPIVINAFAMAIAPRADLPGAPPHSLRARQPSPRRRSSSASCPSTPPAPASQATSSAARASALSPAHGTSAGRCRSTTSPAASA